MPTCPEWTLFDLAQHLGQVHRLWAANVAAGPAAGSLPQAPRERGALLAWSAEGTEQLLGVLRGAGADAGCWTWWGASQSPQTSGAVARHQVQEAAVHTYDAQLTAGGAQSLPVGAGVDGVDEFLHTCCATPSPWPHGPAVVEFHAAEGLAWRLSLSADGARAARLPVPAPEAAGDVAVARVHGTAAELVLFLYGRIPAESLELDGDTRLFDLLRAWGPRNRGQHAAPSCGRPPGR